jgi:hypothetical protein
VQAVKRRHDERGQATIELLAATPILVIAALLVWQMCLVGIVLTSAQNSARTGARVLSRSNSAPAAERAAHRALRGSFRDGSQITAAGQTVRVKVKVPLIVPGLDLPLTLVESASMPNTSF